MVLTAKQPSHNGADMLHIVTGETVVIRSWDHAGFAGEALRKSSFWNLACLILCAKSAARAPSKLVAWSMQI